MDLLALPTAAFRRLSLNIPIQRDSQLRLAVFETCMEQIDNHSVKTASPCTAAVVHSWQLSVVLPPTRLTRRVELFLSYRHRGTPVIAEHVGVTA
jgi:hypothetical protein